jgi:hypothetical protein
MALEMNCLSLFARQAQAGMAFAKIEMEAEKPDSHEMKTLPLPHDTKSRETARTNWSRMSKWTCVSLLERKSL